MKSDWLENSEGGITAIRRKSDLEEKSKVNCLPSSDGDGEGVCQPTSSQRMA